MSKIPQTRLTLLAICAPGLEADLADEIAAFVPDATRRPMLAGVELETGFEGLWQVVHRCRIVEEVRVRIAKFRATDFAALEAALPRVQLHPWLARDARPEVRVTSRKSKLIHTGAIAERVERWLDAQKRTRRGDANPRLHLRFDHDFVTISVDAAPDGLYRRGWRAMVGAAPLRETIAAGVIRAAGLLDQSCIIDPFCGSGTLLVEAALAARGDVAHRRTDLPMTRWPTHPAEAYASWLDAQMPSAPRISPRLVGRDSDARVVEAARANAEKAGCGELIDLDVADFAKVAECGPGAIIANVPWGERLEAGRAAALFKRLGEVLRNNPQLDPVWVLAPEHGFVESTGLRWTAERTIGNRGTWVVLWRLVRAESAA